MICESSTSTSTRLRLATSTSTLLQLEEVLYIIVIVIAKIERTLFYRYYRTHYSLLYTVYVECEEIIGEKADMTVIEYIMT